MTLFIETCNLCVFMTKLNILLIYETENNTLQMNVLFSDIINFLREYHGK